MCETVDNYVRIDNLHVDGDSIHAIMLKEFFAAQ